MVSSIAMSPNPSPGAPLRRGFFFGRLRSARFLGTMIDFVLDGGHGGFHVQNSRKERQCPNHNTCAGSRDCALYAGWLLLEVKPERGVDLNTADNSVTSNW